MIDDDRYTTIPPMLVPESGVVPTRSSKFFSQRHVKTLAELKNGLYIRVFFQPVFSNGRMLSFGVERVYGKPFKDTRKRTVTIFGRGMWKVYGESEAKRESWERKYSSSEYGVNFVDSLGIKSLNNSVVLFRYSSRMWLELQRIASIGDFAAWCFYKDKLPTDESYLIFSEEVEHERYMDQMQSDYLRSAYDYEPDWDDDPSFDYDDDGAGVVDDTGLDPHTSDLDDLSRLSLDAAAYDLSYEKDHPSTELELMNERALDDHATTERRRP